MPIPTPRAAAVPALALALLVPLPAAAQDETTFETVMSCLREAEAAPVMPLDADLTCVDRAVESCAEAESAGICADTLEQALLNERDALFEAATDVGGPTANALADVMAEAEGWACEEEDPSPACGPRAAARKVLALRIAIRDLGLDPDMAPEAEAEE